MILYRRRRQGRAGDIFALGALAAVLAAAAMLVTALAALIAVVAIVAVAATGLIIAVPALRRALLGPECWLAPRSTTRAVRPASVARPGEGVLMTRRTTIARR